MQACAISSGVIQDSVLRPLILSLPINDTLKVFVHSTALLFANVSKMFYCFEAGPFNSMLALISEDLKSPDDLRSKWLMRF